MAVDPNEAGPTQEEPQTWNKYAYVNNNPIGYYDPDGRASIEARALDGPLGLSISGVDYEGIFMRATVVEHWQIYYDDGTNVGFFGTGEKGEIRDDTSTLPHHTLASGYDDSLMKDAVEKVRKQWHSDYCLRGNNCQDFVKSVLMEYYTLMYQRCGPDGCPDIKPPAAGPAPKADQGKGKKGETDDKGGEGGGKSGSSGDKGKGQGGTEQVLCDCMGCRRTGP